MKVGSLFSGGGLGDFGYMAAGMEIAWQCEIDDYCQKILALRYPESKKYTDIKNLKGEDLEKVDLITGGFPCQPFSYAGKKNGKDDNRYLWPEMLKIIKAVRSRWVVGENVPGIINMELDQVCADLEKAGYQVGEPIVFPSHALGAWHKRDRVWIVAYRNSGDGSTKQGKQQNKWAHQFDASGQRNVADSALGRSQALRQSNKGKGKIKLCGQDLSDTDNRGEPLRRDGKFSTASKTQGCRDDFRGGTPQYEPRKWWATEPAVGRVVDGCADRVHRLKMLGNGQVPACTHVIGSIIMEIEKENL